MQSFKSIAEAQLRGEALAMAVFLEADFASGPKRMWTGIGPIQVDGRSWDGIGDILQMTPIRRGENGQADKFEVTVFASMPIIQQALIEFDQEARNRKLRAYLQFFGAVNQTPTGGLWQIRQGTMRGAALAVSFDNRTLTIACDTLSSQRGRPAYGQLTDRDQQARFPGDLGLSFVIDLDGSEVEWPKFDD